MASTSTDSLIDAGIEHLRQGRFPQAEESLRAALESAPDDPEALNLLAVTLHKQDRPAEARHLLERAIASDDSVADVHHNLAEVLAAMGDASGAEASYVHCVTLDPANSLAWRRLANLCHERGDPAGALAASEQALKQTPKDVDLIVWAARLMIIQSRSAEAAKLLGAAIALKADCVDAHCLRYRALAIAEEFDEALSAVELAARVIPGDQKILFDRIQMLYDFGKLDEAEAAVADFIRQFPNDGQGHYLLGCVLKKREDLGAAVVALARSIELRPDHAAGYARLGELLLRMGRLTDAEVQLREANRLDPKLVAPYVHLSIALDKQGMRRPEAIDAAEKAVAVDPNDTEALNWLAMLQVRQGKHTEANKNFQRSLELKPDGVGALTGYGILLSGQGMIEKAWDYFERGMAADLTDPVAVMSAAFYANAHPDLSQDELLALHQRWAKLWHQRGTAKPFTNWDNDHQRDRVLRVGYVSPDFRGHSVSFFFEPLLRAHDRSKVQAIIFDNTTHPDVVTVRLRGLADDWFRIVGAGDERIVELIRSQKIDILVDLSGHTSENRLDIFARHPAPVQVTYLGYPNTTGLPEIEYRITDALADPPGSADTYHTEELIRLPGGAWCFRPADPPIEVADTPAGKSDPVTFCSFNAVHKINQRVIALWARVLAATPGSRMLFKAAGMSDPETKQSIVDGFTRHGIEESRLIFIERTVAYRDHLEIYHRCDIGLDTFPYNGTTTTCEAMWMGVPVIALEGSHHAARVSVSLLSRVGLTELVGKSPDEFVKIAAELAADRPRLAELRKSMRPRMQNSRLMDAKAQASEMEAAYRTMWHKWCARMER